MKYPEKVERRLDRIPDARYPEKGEYRSDRIPNVRYPEKVECWPDRIPDVRYPEKVERWPDRILPPGGMSYAAHRKGESHMTFFREDPTKPSTLTTL